MDLNKLVDEIKVVITTWLFPDLEPAEIGDEADLIEELDMDSLTLIELVLGIEEHFEISLESVEIELEKLRTPKLIAELIQPIVANETT